MEGLLWLSVLGDVLHHGGKGVATGAEGRWSQPIAASQAG